MKWIIFILLIVSVMLVGWYVWVEAERQGPEPATSGRSGNGAASLDAASVSNLVVAGDDHGAEDAAYRAGLESQVDAVVNGTMAERQLPTAALPLLQRRIMAGAPSAATTRPLGEALAKDGIRLANALAIQKRLEWYRKNTLNIFERNCGRKTWAPAARAAIQAAVRLWDKDPRTTGDEDMIIWREARAAHKDGRDDPLLLFAWAQNVIQFNSPDSDRAWIYRASVAAALTMKEAGYPPAIQMAADLQAARGIADNKPVSDRDRKEMNKLLDQSKALFGKVIADPELPRQALLNLFDMMGETSISVYGDRRTLPAPLFEQLKASRVDPSTVLTVQGYFNVDYAWDARGTGWGDTVTTEGSNLCEQRLAKADAALEQAWKLDPSNSDAAAKMISVELGQGEGRDRMELWFKRAMDADPDNYWACLQKLYYLEPKWYGNGEEMLKFGRECLAGGNWDAGIPYVLVKAHLHLAQYAGGQWTPAPQAEYFRNNPQAWTEIRSVYAEDRRHRPRSEEKELQFARVAASCGHWDEANLMFQEVGNGYNSNVLSIPEMDRAKAETLMHYSPSTRPAGF
ncbi:MAG: hypothetical protein ABSB42_21670 [Tepidisphaeraceae bacterium]|jgi:hypothetical protein